MSSSLQINRHTAYNQIQALYMDALEHTYPQLQSVGSVEEMMIEMAMISDVPECNGSFVSSEYETADGKQRAISFTEVQLGDNTTMSMGLVDCDNGIVKTYSLTIGIDQEMWGGSYVNIVGDDTEEDEMLSKVHPSQVSNLARVLHGNLMPYELDMKLAEIQTMSEGTTDELELYMILEYARAQYYLAVERRADEAEHGAYDITANDLREMYAIINERVRQLEVLE